MRYPYTVENLPALSEILPLLGLAILTLFFMYCIARTCHDVNKKVDDRLKELEEKYKLDDRFNELEERCKKLER